MSVVVLKSICIRHDDFFIGGWESATQFNRIKSSFFSLTDHKHHSPGNILGNQRFITYLSTQRLFNNRIQFILALIISHSWRHPISRAQISFQSYQKSGALVLHCGSTLSTLLFTWEIVIVSMDFLNILFLERRFILYLAKNLPSEWGKEINLRLARARSTSARIESQAKCR